MYIRLAGLTLLFSLGGNVFADDHPFIDTDKSQCMQGPVAQFGRYVGDWKISDETLTKDGSGWKPGATKRWIFECIGNGTAVQDFWMPPGGGFGTNLRIYNPDTEKWDIVWTASNVKGFTHISAVQNAEGNIEMEIISPVQDPPRRIIFFTPQGERWNWVMQMSQDSGETWFDVYRITATPWAGEVAGQASPDRASIVVHDTLH